MRGHSGTAAWEDQAGRGHGDAGSALVAGIVLVFAFTFLGMVWLARDVDRGISNRSAAQSIAFQAARSGAQATSISDLRRGAGEATVDEPAAREAVTRTAAALFTSYELEGSITEIVVDRERVSVTLRVTDGGVTVTGAATVRAERTP
jgi:Tfp pilus assembly protein PilX